MTDPSRRSFLKASAVAAGASALAGCGKLPFSGDGDGSFATTSYVLPPAALSDREHLTYRYAAPKTVAEREDDLADETFEGIETRNERLFNATGLDFDEAQAQLSYGPISVARIDHDTASVGEYLEDEDYDDEKLGGFTTYEHDDGGHAVAIDGSVAIGARPAGGEDAIDVLETAVDAARGEEDRFADDSETFTELTDALTGDVRVGRTHEEFEETNAEGGQFAGEVARGLSASLGEDATDLTLALVFAGEGDVATEDVTTWTDTDTFEEWDGVSVSSDGRVATVTATVPTDSFAPSVPSTSTTSFLEWVPKPELLNTDRLSPYRIAASKIAEYQDSIGPNLYSSLYGLLPDAARSIGVEFESTPEMILFYPHVVVRTDMSKSEMASGLEEKTDLEKDSSHAGYDIYTRDDGNKGVAIGDRVLVRSFGDDAVSLLQAILDANRGEAKRYVDVDDWVGTLANAVGTGHFAGVQRWEPITGRKADPKNARFQGSVGLANAYVFADETTELAASYGFDTAEDVDTEAVRNYLEERGTAFTTSVDSYDLTERERRVDVTGTASTDDVGYDS